MHFLPLNLILVCNSGKIKNSRFSCWPFTRTFWSNSRKPLRGLRAQESGKWIKKTIWWVSSGWFVPVIIFFNEYKFRPQRLELPFASIFRVTARWATCPGPRRRPPTSPSPWSSCSSSPTPPSWSSSSWGRGSYQSLGKSCWDNYYCIDFNNIHRCPESWCAVFDAFTGISIVMNSCLNPYIFLFFNSDNRKASHITNNCCLNRSDRDERWEKPFLENSRGTCAVRECY